MTKTGTAYFGMFFFFFSKFNNSNNSGDVSCLSFYNVLKDNIPETVYPSKFRITNLQDEVLHQYFVHEKDLCVNSRGTKVNDRKLSRQL